MTTTGNGQRDELAEAAYRGNYNDRNSPGIQPLAERSDNERRRMYATADAILAAGYRKPRTVTTVEELDALPVESVVRSGMGNVYIKDHDLDNPTDTWWVAGGGVSEYRSSRILLPATALWESKAGVAQ